MSSEPEDEEEKNTWEDLLRKMLPEGAPFPDEEHLDYSIAVQYDGPLPHNIPKINPLFVSSTPIQTSSIVSKHSRFHRHHLSAGLSNASPSLTESGRSSSVSTAQLGSPNADMEDSDCSQVDTVAPIDSSMNQEEDVVVNGNIEEERMSPPRSSVDGGLVSPLVSRKLEKWLWKNVACSRCGNKNRLKEREACIVCDARYCSNCLLKAMGSMPEGRKCLGCIGKPLSELRRSDLGKCSRMLSKVCSPWEVAKIMKAEIECSTNQLRPEQLIVNGRHLRQDELDELFSCSMPPINLKPGNYWYDKDSGFWGKEGEKPDMIISSQLNVGGKLRRDASNGNTKVYINGREITKNELRVLKLAKVQCTRDTHYWVYDDGSYVEEGQNNLKENIWGKAPTRLLCSLFSLPVPPKNSRDKKGDANTYSGRPQQGGKIKLFLFGPEGSGTGTIFKQAKFLYGDKFSPDEIQNIKLIIQSNLYKYLSALLEGRERLEEATMVKNHAVLEAGNSVSGECESDNNIYSINKRLKHFCDWLLEIVAKGDMETYFPAATREYASLVDEVWKDPAIQETYKRREELDILVPDVAKYFLDRAVEISSNEYEPSEKDILYAEGVSQSNGVAFFDFSFDESETPMPCSTKRSRRYQLIRINSKGCCKWLGMLEDIRAVIFCIDLSHYDHNKILASKDLFQSLVKHPCFKDTPFILLLNKYDAFEDKITKVPLAVCDWFKDFNPPLMRSSQMLAQLAFYYVAVKFKELYASMSGRKLFVLQSRARDQKSIDEAFNYIKEILIWEEEKDEDDDYFGHGEDSFNSTE